MRRRKNFSTASWKGKGKFSGKPISDVYSEWHWGIPHQETVTINDPTLPEHLIECGRLVEFTYRKPDQSTRIKDKLFKLPRAESNKTHLAFDPDHEFHRLYIVSPDQKVRKKFRTELYKPNPHIDMPLWEMSMWVGGCHATEDYPDLEARVLGVMTTVVYACEKEGDGYSFYVHEMGEESGVKPLIAISKCGRLWIVGGDYHAPTPGITN